MKNVYLLVILAVSIASRSNGAPGKNTNSGTGSDTVPDTVYYQTESFANNEKVYSITYYNSNLTVREYRVFYVNGQTSYYCQYDYDAGECTKIRYYNASNELTFYGVYSPNSIGGKDYSYYDKNNVRLWIAQYNSLLSALDSTWRCEKTVAYTTDNKIYSQKVQEYTTDGWLSKEIYFDHKNDTVAVGVWGFDLSSSNTSYTYIIKNESTIYNESRNYRYNKYRYYYHGTNSNADSAKTYLDSTLLYTVKFGYDTKGWLKKETFFDKANTAINRGEYSFDKTTNQTSYSYYREPSELLYVTISDFSGLKTGTEYYSNNQLDYRVKYTYNSDNLYDTISKISPSGSLISYETYTYYTPYNFTKKYTSFDGYGNISSFYNYNEFGVVTDSMPLQTGIRVGANGKSSLNMMFIKNGSIVINVDKECSVDLSLISLNGKTVGQIKGLVPSGHSPIQFDVTGKMGSGNYILSGSAGGIPVRRYIRTIR